MTGNEDKKLTRKEDVEHVPEYVSLKPYPIVKDHTFVRACGWLP